MLLILILTIVIISIIKDLIDWITDIITPNYYTRHNYKISYLDSVSRKGYKTWKKHCMSQEKKKR